ncbi:MAG: hypothetical protein ACREIV_02615, partial [Planctomycetaceae bacterium]
MSDERWNVLLLGDATRAEMRSLPDEIVAVFPRGALVSAADVPAAVRLVTGRGWYPDLVVVCQNQSDEFSRSDAERLLALLPLARWIVCYGAWCVSDGRNRDLVPLSVRVPVPHVAERLRQERDVLRGRRAPLPWTAGRDEIFAFETAPTESGPFCGPTSIRVVTPDRALGEWLRDLLRSAGCRLVADADPAAVVLWDADPLREERPEELRVLCSANTGSKVIALMTMPHPQNVENLKACGAIAV